MNGINFYWYKLILRGVYKLVKNKKSPKVAVKYGRVDNESNLTA
jgi:hypothetical protein